MRGSARSWYYDAPQIAPGSQRFSVTGRNGLVELLTPNSRGPMVSRRAFLTGRDFIGSDFVALVFGDNIFNGDGLPAMLQRAAQRRPGTIVFVYQTRGRRLMAWLSWTQRQDALDRGEAEAGAVASAVTGRYS